MARPVRQAQGKQNAPGGGDSYYTVIRGKKYDRRMLELAEGLTQGRGDGRISINDAKNLLRVVKDANNYSDTEKLTMEYIRRHYRFTKEADEFFRTEIRKWAAGKQKKKQAEKPAEKKVSPGSAAAPTPADAAPHTTVPVQGKRSSATKQILLALLLLALATLFWFIAYKSSCARPVAIEPVKTAEQVVPAPTSKAAAAPSEPAVAKPATTAHSAELIDFVNRQRLIFIAEKSSLTPASEQTLDALAKRLKNESVRLRVTGHSCSLGTKPVNQEISEKRARVVKDALVARGVAADKIETRGIADSEPAGDNRTVAGRVASRRVTFAVISQ